VNLLLDSLARLSTDGLLAAAPVLRQAASAFASADISVGDGLRWGLMAYMAACFLWDDDVNRSILDRHLQLARNAGALEQLPIYLEAAGIIAVWSGDFGGAAALIAEAETICEATGARYPSYTALLLACLRGGQAEAVAQIDATRNVAEAGGGATARTYASWAAAVLYNGLGRYDEAREAARQAARERSWLALSVWAIPELIEAAARSGDKAMADEALTWLTDTTQIGGTDWGLGIEARSRALVSAGQAAENLYRESIDRLGGTKLRPEIARAHLLYGEWLRRENRRADAREQLRTAYNTLDEIGMHAFAERARRELLATGETARKRVPQTAGAAQELTPQEAQVAQLARDGLSNPEIGARLFISSHTVQYHLGKVFAKLGISSRGQLPGVLPG
jgi:DNA-binding CsgD family transcriptional regulator